MSNIPNRAAPGAFNQIKPDDRSAPVRELDQRTSDGITVTMLWNAETNRVFVSVLDERHGVSFEFMVPPADAADAFHRPYAYCPPDEALAA